MTASAQPLPTMPVHAIQPQPTTTPWLVQKLWSANAVGIIGGAPKTAKSWLGLDMAVAVASGTACLNRFSVDTPGRVIAYLAEDALPAVRQRVAQLCQIRGLDMAGLDLHIVTAPSLRLDLEHDQEALDQTLATLKPKMLLLDPLVRLHRLDENSAADISGILGFLRQLNRCYNLAIILVHHMAKRPRRDLGQALRGSSDLHAWTDSACYLVHHNDKLRLTIQHRAAPAPEPMMLRLVGGDQEPCSLILDSDDPQPIPLADAVRAILPRDGTPTSRAQLRNQLHVNNARLGTVLEDLKKRGLVRRSPKGWYLPEIQHQLQLNIAN